MSLRKLLTLIVLLGSLVPTYLVGTLLIDRHSHYLMEQKQLKLESSRSGVRTSVTQELSNIVNLTNWHARDRLLALGADNILYSAIVTQKLGEFKQLAEPITSTFVLDRTWSPMYESNGSLYHLERSQLLQHFRQHQEVFVRGETLHTEFINEQLVVSGGQNGIALITPLLSYTLLPGSEYEPKGYLVVLISYDDLIALSAPYLFDQESATIEYKPAVNGASTLYQVLDAQSFHSPLYFDIDLQLSDRAREQALLESKNQLNSAMLITLLVLTLVGIGVSQWVLKPVRALERVVLQYQRGEDPNRHSGGFQFAEFKQVLGLTDKLWKRVNLQMRELEEQNQALQHAHQEVKQSNLQLADFNHQLENKVSEKTAELRLLLDREEHYQQNLVQVIDFFSNRNGVTYRTIPMVCNLFLSQLFPTSQQQFRFTKPLSGHYEPLLSIEGQSLGYLQLERSKLDEQQQMLVAVFGKQLSSWLELEVLAREDSLCQILNRKAFDEDMIYFRDAVVQSRLATLSLIMIDINGLKPLNDTYGHHKGDDLLKLTVKLLSPGLLESDTLYRIGGDEFVILSQNLDRVELRNKVEALKRLNGTEQVRLPDGRRYPVTFSVGSAISLETPLEGLYAQADASMYQDKRQHYLSHTQTEEPSL